jgi:hypothetical protein
MIHVMLITMNTFFLVIDMLTSYHRLSFLFFFFFSTHQDIDGLIAHYYWIGYPKTYLLMTSIAMQCMHPKFKTPDSQKKNKKVPNAWPNNASHIAYAVRSSAPKTLPPQYPARGPTCLLASHILWAWAWPQPFIAQAFFFVNTFIAQADRQCPDRNCRHTRAGRKAIRFRCRPQQSPGGRGERRARPAPPVGADLSGRSATASMHVLEWLASSHFGGTKDMLHY